MPKDINGDRGPAGPGEFGQDIATRAELLRRLKERQTPKPGMNLTPGGRTEIDTKRRLEALREKRIEHLADRLTAARETLRQDHSKAGLAGRARADFDRSR